jgi:hypothetical protein
MFVSLSGQLMGQEQPEVTKADKTSLQAKPVTEKSPNVKSIRRVVVGEKVNGKKPQFRLKKKVDSNEAQRRVPAVQRDHNAVRTADKNQTQNSTPTKGIKSTKSSVSNSSAKTNAKREDK